MSAESLIVTLTDGTTDWTYNKVSSNGYASRWAYSGNTASVRLFVDVDHAVAPLGSTKSDVHTLTFRREAINSSTGNLAVAKVSLQITVPKDTVIDDTDVANLISQLCCLFNKNFMATFAQGATPSGDYNVTGPFNPVRS